MSAANEDDATTTDGPRFVFDEPCDWSDDEGARTFCAGDCGTTPTAHAGDIYYACEDHLDAFREWLADDGGEAA